MSFRLPPPWGEPTGPDPDATQPDKTRPESAATRPALPANDYAQAPYPLPAPQSVRRRQSPRTLVAGAGIIAGIVLLVVLLLPLASGGRWGIPLFPRSTAERTAAPPGSPALQPSATGLQATATMGAPTATTAPLPCSLPATTSSVKAPSASASFHFTLAAGVEAWYIPALEDEANGQDTLPISLCLPHQSFAQLMQAITIGDTFWHAVTPCSAVACWSVASKTLVGNPYSLSLTLAHTPNNDAGAVLTLAMTTLAASPASLANATDQYTIEPGAATADIGEASATSITPLGTALVALPAAGLTYDTLHLSTIAHDCGNAQPAYSARAVDVTVTASICARTNTSRYSKLKISYTSGQIAFVSGVVYPTVFW